MSDRTKTIGIKTSRGSRGGGRARKSSWRTASGGQKGQIPIFGYVPVKRIKRIDKDGKEPEVIEGLFGESSGFLVIGATHNGAKNNDRKCCGVFESIG